MEPNNQALNPQAPSKFPNPLPEEPIVVQNNPRNKMDSLNTFFMTLDILLFLLFTIFTLFYLSTTCSEMGCFVVLPFLFGFTPILAIALYGINNIIYNHSKNVVVKNFSEIRHTGTFKSHLKLTTFLIFLTVIPIILPIYSNFSRQQSDKKYIILKNEINTMQAALERYKAKNGNYPSNLKELVSNGYMEKIPLNPMTNKPFEYKSFETNFQTGYRICGKFYDTSEDAPECVINQSPYYKIPSMLYQDNPNYK